MIQVIKRIFGDKNERAVKSYWPIVEQINIEFEKLSSLTDEELRAKTDDFRGRVKAALSDIETDQDEIRAQLAGGKRKDDSSDNAEDLSLDDRHDLYDEMDELDEEWHNTLEQTLEDLLPEVFAVAKDACRRLVGKSWMAGGQEITWEMVPYDVQLLGAIVLHRGNIAEMKTGEGKTLVAVGTVYLNALPGHGVHLVTVNPYLAERDSEWMGPVYELLGLTVDVIDRHEPHSLGRKKAYEADVTYGTNNEFGFDYLRDNSFVVDKNHLMQRKHHFAIVDEVDSVLIDEARTPLIISGPVPESDETQFQELQPSVERLVHSQQKLVAGFVAEAERLLKERDAAVEAGENKKASELESDAGLALLRAHRGYPKNKRLRKLYGEIGIEQLKLKTEYYYLQDNAKNMPFVDAELHFAFDEKQRAIEMSEKGRTFIAKVAGQDSEMFILPDLGEEVATIEKETKSKLLELAEKTEALEDLSEEKKKYKVENDSRVIRNEQEEQKRGIYNTYADRAARLHAVEQLLKAYIQFEKDTEYIIEEGKIMIVDEHTGRVLGGRRYSDGLHQALEAKEGVKIHAATQTYASVTLQNFFRLYSKLAGMTGTAETEAEEFFKIYDMDVIVIPTNRPVKRDDLDDLVFKTRREKYNAVIEKVREYNEKGQPVLVGTTTVDISETLSRMLTRAGIKHNVLNAKQDRAGAEALIVAEAGQQGAVTIATNMAGRGTDIKLGEGVVDVGGLAIVGTERHESRRIDLQLRGRAGRQGDPGESQFYVSLDDNLMRLFGSDRVAKVMDRLDMEEGAVITHPWVNKSIERAQKKIEQNNFGIRKRQLEYDDVLNAQRHVIYDRRSHALTGERMRGELMDMLRTMVDDLAETHHAAGTLAQLRDELLRTLALDFELDEETFQRLGEEGVADRIFELGSEMYTRKRDALAKPFFESMKQVLASEEENKPEKVFVDFTDGRRVLRAVVPVELAVESEGQEVNDAMERSAMLSIIDAKWTDHLRNLDEVKEGIGLRAYGQRDPVIEYKMEAFKLFAEMIGEVGSEVVSFIFRSGPLVDRQAAPRPRSSQRRLDPKRARSTHAASSSFNVGGVGGNRAEERDPTAKSAPIIVDDKIGRNDPCPCGSGKKYKRCHGR